MRAGGSRSFLLLSRHFFLFRPTLFWLPYLPRIGVDGFGTRSSPLWHLLSAGSLVTLSVFFCGTLSEAPLSPPMGLRKKWRRWAAFLSTMRFWQSFSRRLLPFHTKYLR